MRLSYNTPNVESVPQNTDRLELNTKPDKNQREAYEHQQKSVTSERKRTVAALELINDDVTYDSKYFSINYPYGDVPSDNPYGD